MHPIRLLETINAEHERTVAQATRRREAKRRDNRPEARQRRPSWLRRDAGLAVPPPHH